MTKTYLQWLKEDCGYWDVRDLGNGRWAAVMPLAYTHAVITGRMGDMVSIADRWCYHGYRDARDALAAWDGTGEPKGWHRHPQSGRRVSQTADEIDDAGRTVGAAGVVYVRG